MDVAEEEQAQIAKRQAIQSIMRDTSLTPQEKQKKIQEFMTGGAQAAAPAPAEGPAPAPATAGGASKQELVKAIMKDTSLSAQEKQKQIQQIMSGATPPASSPAPEPAPVPAPSEPEPPAATGAPNNRAAIQDVMKDTSLTPQQKQQKIQQLMAGAPAAAPSAAAAAAASRPAGVGATASTDADPAARKGARGSSTISSQAAAATGSSGSNEPAPPPMGLGAVASTGVDPAARKGGRASSRSTATAPAASDTASVEPAAMAPPTLGAVSSSGVDPAARKARGSARASGRASAASSVDGQSVGASSASRHDDPAARKAARAARQTASASASVASVGGQEAPVKSDPAMSKGEVPAAAVSYGGSGEISEIRDLESNLVAKPNTVAPPAPAPASFPTSNNYAASVDTSGARGLVAVTEDDGYEQSNYVESSEQEQRETYAGVGLTGPDIVGAETGGFQAFVAGEEKPEVIGAMEVVTDAAIEEEDNQKRKRLLRIGGGVFCLLLIAIVVPVAIVVPGGGEDKLVNVTDSPTMAPSAPPTAALFAELLDTLQPLYPSDESFEEAFSSYGTPQYKAADWATTVAPIGLSGSDPRMISRYALATFYYATNGDNWERCGISSTNCDEGREWLTAENECDWLAVECADRDGGDYTVLELFFPPTGPFGNNVAGTLPFELTLLPSVERIVLSRQALKGSIPETWSGMTALHTLIIGNNELTGTFPDFLFSENTLLGTLYVSSNKLSGTLPAFASASLEGLRFEENMFTGPIPPAFGSLAALKELYADNNELEGDLPEELYNLPALRSLRLSNNTKMTGTISESIGNLQSLDQLRVVNTGMGGPLPAGLFNLINLQVLELSVNDFSGPLSVDFGKLANVTQIDLSYNTFTGTIPTVFASLEYLRTLLLHSNDLTGSVSAGICNRTGDAFFDINRLTVDCGGSPPEVSCDCCHECF